MFSICMELMAVCVKFQTFFNTINDQINKQLILSCQNVDLLSDEAIGKMFSIILG